MTSLLGLALVVLALGGCATSLTVSDTRGETAAGSPRETSPTALPPNVFAPEPSHYFGTGGP